MVNDILEQIAEDYFRCQGYFTQHNIKYRPELSNPSIEQSRKYSVNSDIDILAIHPLKTDISRVIVISCKSWQGGLNITQSLNDFTKNPKILRSGREVWKYYREIVDPVWAQALKQMVRGLTGTDKFIFYDAVIKYRGKKEDWEEFSLFKKVLSNCPVKIIDLKTMVNDLCKQITNTPAHSELSRLLQLVKASGGKLDKLY
jgi:hypothetical protein